MSKKARQKILASWKNCSTVDVATGYNRPFPISDLLTASVSNRVFPMVFYLKVHFHTNQTHFI